MFKKLLLSIFFLCFSFIPIFGQAVKESISESNLSPLMIKNILIFNSNKIGWQMGVAKQVWHITKYKNKPSGKVKVVSKDRLLWGSIGFYRHKDLHTNVFMTVDYSYVKNYRRNFYREFIPTIGISRTFLNSTTYFVDDMGNVKQKKAGDWRIAAGFSSGIGKNFDSKKAKFVRDIYLRINTQIFYPNFRFIAVQSSFLLGLTFNIDNVKVPFKNRVIINKR